MSVLPARGSDYDLKDRLRNARNKESLSAWIATISQILDVERAADTLSPGESGQFEGEFWAVVKDNAERCRAWPPNKREQLAALLRQVARDVGDIDIVLLDASPRHLAALRLPCKVVLERTFALWDAIGGEQSCDIAIGTTDLSGGLLLEFSHMSEDEEGNVMHGSDIYELTTWGNLEIATRKALGEAQ
jgi:hypothetical protein